MIEYKKYKPISVSNNPIKDKNKNKIYFLVTVNLPGGVKNTECKNGSFGISAGSLQEVLVLVKTADFQFFFLHFLRKSFDFSATPLIHALIPE